MLACEDTAMDASQFEQRFFCARDGLDGCGGCVDAGTARWMWWVRGCPTCLSTVYTSGHDMHKDVPPDLAPCYIAIVSVDGCDVSP